jgi:small ligand-binding sensory domain FIST
VAASFKAGFAAGADWRAAAGACLEQLQPAPAGANVGFVYVSDRLAGDFAAIVERLREATGVASWAGTVGIGICATGTEYFDRPAITAMLGTLPEGSFALFDSKRDAPQAFAQQHAGWLGGDTMPFGVVHADPRTESLVEDLARLAETTGSYLVGALPSSRGPHPQVAGALSEGGITGLIWSGETAVTTALTQGCAPIGPQHTVTAAQRNIVIELDGRPALDVLKEDVGELLARDLRRLGGYIFAALPVAGTDWGDYLVRNLAGLDPNQGLVAIGDMVEPGQALMFCRRDRATAADDLQRMLGRLKGRLARAPKGALYHTCLARGPNMFPGESAELGMIREALGDVPLAGFFGNGEISNGRLYTYTGVLTLFL